MTENRLQHKLLELASSLGILGYKVEAIGRKGFPDILLICSGKTLFVEVKIKTGRVSPVQHAVHADLRNNGAEVWVTDTTEGFLNALQRYFDL